MNHSIAISELLANPANLLQRVVEEQQTLLLTEGDQPVAEIRPVQRHKSGNNLADILASLPRLTPDEAEAFARDIEEGRHWLNQQPKRDPWKD